jgi:hypothetical protein
VIHVWTAKLQLMQSMEADRIIASEYTLRGGGQR